MTVSFGSPLDAKELVRQAIDIVDLVGRSIQLRRQGRIYVGLCPWHEDSRPSLQVNPERQSWKCWVCDVGGDIFSFVMKMEGVSFPEALQMLAASGHAVDAMRVRGFFGGFYVDAIAGICNATGRIFGLMPHPEHAVEDLTGPGTDGLGLFASALKVLTA